jgi:hypothetical protein
MKLDIVIKNGQIADIENRTYINADIGIKVTASLIFLIIATCRLKPLLMRRAVSFFPASSIFMAMFSMAERRLALTLISSVYPTASPAWSMPGAADGSTIRYFVIA